MHPEKPTSQSHFSALISEIVRDPKYAIANSEDIHGQPRVFKGEEAEAFAQSHNELLLFETTRAWQPCVYLFFLPWFREVPSTLSLIATIKRPTMDHQYPPQVMCFDPKFFDHLEILKANGMVLNNKMSNTTTNHMTMGYIWNSARGLYVPVLQKK